jgi:hypothetical protein
LEEKNGSDFPKSLSRSEKKLIIHSIAKFLNSKVPCKRIDLS